MTKLFHALYTVKVLAGMLVSFSLFADPAHSPPDSISRAAWGAKPAVGPYRTHVIERITIHHQGVRASEKQDSAKRLRTMQSFHQSAKRGFVDISYHFVIDQKGNLYKGRPLFAAGETKTDYNPAGHLLICLLGDFNTQQPTQKQLETLRNLVRWGLTTFHLSDDTVKTHRDYAHTDCPGDNLYRIVHDGAFLR